MKKLTILAAVLLTFGLASCGGGSGNSDSSTIQTNEAAEQAALRLHRVLLRDFGIGKKGLSL